MSSIAKSKCSLWIFPDTSFSFCHPCLLLYNYSLIKLKKFWPFGSQTQILNFLLCLSFGNSLQHFVEQLCLKLLFWSREWNGTAWVLGFLIMYCSVALMGFYFFQHNNFSLDLNLPLICLDFCLAWRELKGIISHYYWG